MNLAAMLIATYCQRTGMSRDSLESYLQLFQQRDRAAGPEDGEWAHLAGLLGEDPPARASSAVGRGMPSTRSSRSDPQKLFTEACLHGLRARLSEGVDSLDHYLPPRVAEMARKVAGVLEEPQPAPAEWGPGCGRC